MKQRRDPSLINFEHLLKMHYKLDFDEVKAHKYISKIDPNYVYDDLYPETLLGLLARCYPHVPYVTIEILNDLIEHTDPVYLTPHTGSPVGHYGSPLRVLLLKVIIYNKTKPCGVINNVLCLIRKMIAKMDFSLPDSVQFVQQMIALKQHYNDFNDNSLREYDYDLTALLCPDLVMKGALIYSDVIRIYNGKQEATGVELLYLLTKANVHVDAGIVEELLAFV